MIKQIQLRGISRSPSDRMTSDGGCSESLNVITDNTELAPMPMPEDITSELGLPKNFSGEVLYIHSCGGKYRNVIIKSGSSIVAYMDGGKTQVLMTDATLINDINSLGNVLLIIMNGDIHYFLFNYGRYSESQSGALHLPQITISAVPDTFVIGSATGHPAITNSSQITSGVKNAIYSTMREAYQNGVEKSSDRCKYRFLRYSFLFYDGSEFYSDPIIIKYPTPQIVSATASADVRIYRRHIQDAEGNTTISETISNPTLSIFCKIEKYTGKINISFEDNEYSKLLKLKNIITGIRIYVTSDFENFNDYKDFTYLKDEGNVNIKCNVINEYNTDDPTTESSYTESVPISLYQMTYSYSSVKDSIKNISTFRLVNTFLFEPGDLDNVQQLSANITAEIPNNDTLETYPSLNYEQEYAPSIGSFKKINIYNNKLIGIGNPSLPELKNLPHSIATDAETSGSKRGLSYSFTFEIVEPVTGEIKVVTAKNGDYGEWWNFQKQVLGILFFPDTNCHRVYITARKTTYLDGKPSGYIYLGRKYYDMKEHLTLTGYSYVLIDETLSKDLSSLLSSTGTEFTEEEKPQDTEATIENKRLYVSEMDNPFIFTAKGVFSFDDEIMGIATTTKALSSGQFGQFPLYVFTKGGIWSMETAADGSFVSKKPLSRDVALSADCITQIEQAVVFTTDKGVMLLTGSDIKNISPFMTGKHYVLEDQSAGMLGKSGTWSPLLPAVSDATPFMDFMRSAKCAYDYTGQRLLFFNDGEAYQYVYKFDTDTWHKMSLDIPPFEDHQYIRLNIGAYAPDLVDLTGLFGWFESHGTTMVRPIEEWTTEKMQMGGTYLIGYNDNEDNYNYLYEYFNDGSPWNMQADLDGFNNTQKVSVLNTYPDCWVSLRVKDGGTKILNLSTAFDTDKVQPLKGIIVTRPFDLEEPDIRKAIRSIRIRGNFNRNDVKYILQASMDGIHWGVLPSLRAGSFKLFRLVLLCDLEAYERISYIDIDYETRFTNRLR
jgi:hypothetical protein